MKPQQGFNCVLHQGQTPFLQIQALNDFLPDFQNPAELWLRPRSGAGAQEHSEIFPQLLQGWVDAQKKFGFKVTWTTNATNSAQEEAQSFLQATTAGLQIHLIEIGNEQYLKNKYPDMTFEGYITICNATIAALAFAGLPFGIQIAPFGKSTPSRNKYYFDWNTAIYAWEEQLPSDLDLRPVLHVYAPDNQFYWELVDECKTNFGTPIFISEYGAKTDTGDDVPTAAQEVELANKLFSLLTHPGDVMMSHRFWGNYAEPKAQIGWYNNDSMTLKGEAMMPVLFPIVVVPPAPVGPFLKSYTKPVSTLWWKQILTFTDGTYITITGGLHKPSQKQITDADLGKPKSTWV